MLDAHVAVELSVLAMNVLKTSPCEEGVSFICVKVINVACFTIFLLYFATVKRHFDFIFHVISCELFRTLHEQTPVITRSL